MESFSLKIRNKTRFSTLTTLVRYSQSYQAREIKRIYIRKDEVTWSLFSDDTILYPEDTHTHTHTLQRKTPRTNKNSAKEPDTKSTVFLYPHNKHTDK